MKDIRHINPEAKIAGMDGQWFIVMLEDNNGTWWTWQGIAFIQFTPAYNLVPLVDRQQVVHEYFRALTDARDPGLPGPAAGTLHLFALSDL
jgi:hypothetical protein